MNVRQVLQRDPLEDLGQEILLPSEDAGLVAGAFVHERADEIPNASED